VYLPRNLVFFLQNQFPSLVHISLRLLRILNQKPKENKEPKSFVNTSISTLRTLNNILIQNFTLLEEMSSLTDTQTIKKILVAAVMGIQHMLILEEVLMEEGHHSGKLFGAACLLRKRGPYFDQLGRG
jgi:hypothetical protein